MGDPNITVLLLVVQSVADPRSVRKLCYESFTRLRKKLFGSTVLAHIGCRRHAMQPVCTQLTGNMLNWQPSHSGTPADPLCRRHLPTHGWAGELILVPYDRLGTSLWEMSWLSRMIVPGNKGGSMPAASTPRQVFSALV